MEQKRIEAIYTKSEQYFNRWMTEFQRTMDGYMNVIGFSYVLDVFRTIGFHANENRKIGDYFMVQRDTADLECLAIILTQTTQYYKSNSIFYAKVHIDCTDRLKQLGFKVGVIHTKDQEGALVEYIKIKLDASQWCTMPLFQDATKGVIACLNQLKKYDEQLCSIYKLGRDSIKQQYQKKDGPITSCLFNPGLKFDEFQYDEKTILQANIVYLFECKMRRLVDYTYFMVSIEDFVAVLSLSPRLWSDLADNNSYLSVVSRWVNQSVSMSMHDSLPIYFFNDEDCRLLRFYFWQQGLIGPIDETPFGNQDLNQLSCFVTSIVGDDTNPKSKANTDDDLTCYST